MSVFYQTLPNGGLFRLALRKNAGITRELFTHVTSIDFTLQEVCQKLMSHFVCYCSFLMIFIENFEKKR